MEITFPCAVVSGGRILKLFDAPMPFTGPDEVQHPQTAWLLWSAADWASMCLGWRVLPLVNTPPSVSGKRAERRPEAEWIIGTDAVEVAYRLVDLTPAEIEAAKPPVPTAVTNFQARAALLAAGLFGRVDAAIKAQPQDSPAYQAWEYANEITRTGTLVNSVAETLGFTATQLDDLFRQAATIEA